MTVRRPPSLTLPHTMGEGGVGGRDKRMRDAGCGMWDAGYESRLEAVWARDDLSVAHDR